MEDLLYDGYFFSNTLLSEGYPDNWVEEDVVKIVILNNEKINDTKLEKFYDIVQSDYNRTKLLFGIKYDYYFFLEENMTIGLNEIEGIGKPGIIKTEIVNDSENLIKVTRFVIYKGKPVPAYIYILEDVN